jgi:glycosyltransferase involved in cell wall biosynthesis
MVDVYVQVVVEIMHICFITHEYPKPGFSHGGIGTFVKTIASKLVENGIDVSIVGINFTSNNEETTDSGVRIHRLKKNTIKGISWWLNYKQINSKISEIHRKNPIDIVETSELGLAFINKKKAIKYVIRLHGGHHFFSEAENRNINKWRGFQEKRAFSKADAFKQIQLSRVCLLFLQSLDFLTQILIQSPKNGIFVFRLSFRYLSLQLCNQVFFGFELLLRLIHFQHMLLYSFCFFQT